MVNLMKIERPQNGINTRVRASRISICSLGKKAVGEIGEKSTTSLEYCNHTNMPLSANYSGQTSSMSLVLHLYSRLHAEMLASPGQRPLSMDLIDIIAYTESHRFIILESSQRLVFLVCR